MNWIDIVSNNNYQICDLLWYNWVSFVSNVMNVMNVIHSKTKSNTINNKLS